MLWFCLGHSPIRSSRGEVNADILNRRFHPARGDIQIHVLGRMTATWPTGATDPTDPQARGR